MERYPLQRGERLTPVRALACHSFQNWSLRFFCRVQSSNCPCRIVASDSHSCQPRNSLPRDCPLFVAELGSALLFRAANKWHPWRRQPYNSFQSDPPRFFAGPRIGTSMERFLFKQNFKRIEPPPLPKPAPTLLRPYPPICGIDKPVWGKKC